LGKNKRIAQKYGKSGQKTKRWGQGPVTGGQQKSVVWAKTHTHHRGQGKNEVVGGLKKKKKKVDFMECGV